jgi:ATP-dependent RNA helicase DDX3X
MMFSATFASEVQLMAKDFLYDYVFITVGRVGSASELVTQSVHYAGDVKQKVHALERVLKEHTKQGDLSVIFVETKRAADTLELELHEKGVGVCAIHGDRDQSQREEALHSFKTGANPVMVATDVAARGLDIPNVTLVINFDMPKQLDDYVHRIGRTGRAGRKGFAVAFVNERCSYLPDLGDLLRNAKQEIPGWFDELIQARGSGGRLKRDNNRFGGADMRQQEEVKERSVATPQRSTFNAPARTGNEFGNTGAEDAW